MQNRNRSSGAKSQASPKKVSQATSIPAEVASIIVFGLGIFALCALVTYSPADPSFFSNVKHAASNSCGKVGAYLSSGLIECFGIAAFLLPAAFWFLASTIHKKEGSVRFVGTLGGMSVAVMSLTVFLTLQWKFWPYSGSLILTGGAFGAWLAEILLRQFNPLGSSIVSLLLFLLAIVVSTPVSVARYGAWILSHGSRISLAVGRFVATYTAYLFGLVVMKAAHKLGDLVHQLIDGAIKRGQNRAEAARAVAAGEGTASETEAENTVSPASESAQAQSGKGDSKKKEKAPPVNPVIGLDVSAVKAEVVANLNKASVDSAPTFEAPNIFPELEPQKAAAPLQGKPPEILPHENPQNVPLPGFEVSIQQNQQNLGPQNLTGVPSTLLKDAGSKAAAKLAKLARIKRGNWKLPPIDFLKKVPKIESSIDREKLIQNSQILRQKFADFGIDGEVTAVRPGPVITLYEFKPGPGVKVSRIAALADDLSMALSAQSVRILAPLPGKSVVGIEIPSDLRETVYMREFLQHPDFFGNKHILPVVMGKDIAGQTYLSDLARMPHLLCAGQTGAGKSVFMNGLICSLFFRFTPDELRMILVDPKFIEFRAYQDIPHLLLPVVDDPKLASTALKWAVREMERRYRILAMMGSRNLAAYNQKVDEMGSDVVRDFLQNEENQPEGLAQMSGGDWLLAFEPDEMGAPRIGKLPFIVVIIDELADLMMIAKKEVEISIARIAQKARAAGIHLVIATQRPSTDVVTGLIKANLPSRVSFQLASYIDSKTILDRAGAERLLGQGDMLFIPPGVSSLLRLHGAYLDDDEISKITTFLKAQGKPAYRDEILVDEEGDDEGSDGGDDTDDELFQEAMELVKRSGHASASFLQRHLKVGYNRAARMIETMEMRGIVGPADGARPREVLIR